MKAIIIRGTSATVEEDHPVPQLRDEYLLVKTHAIALNPTDWKTIAGGGAAKPLSISGCDYAGVVDKVGSAVPLASDGQPWKAGDRICGVASGANASNPEDGVFAEYAVVKADVQMRMPENLSYEQAATVSLGAITCGQGLFQPGKGLGLNLPTDPVKDGPFLLIYGGSTATGTLGIQYAKLAGYTVLTTASPHNHALVKSLGASAVFDYNDSDCAAAIKAHTANKLKLAWDTVGTKASAQICADALSSEAGCSYGTILRDPLPRDDVEYHSSIMYTMFGEAFDKFGMHFPASPEDHEFAKKWMAMTQALLADGKLKTHPEKVGELGLQGALQGMADMKAGKISGTKLVYRVGETP